MNQREFPSRSRVNGSRVLSPSTAALLVASLAAPAFLASSQTVWNVDGDGDYNVSGNWDPAVVPNNAAESVTVSNPINPVNGVEVTLASLTRTLGDLSIEDSGTADLNRLILNNATLFVQGVGITNNGEIAVNSSALLRLATTTLSGDGLIRLAGGTLGDNGGVQEVQIQQAGHTIAGFGNLGNNTLGLVNETGGLISADVSGQVLNWDPGVTNGNTNAGTAQAINGGILRLTGSSGGDFNNAGGTLAANGAGSAVEYTASASVTGGTLTSTAGGVHRTIEGQSVFFRDVTLAAGTPLNVGNNTDLEFFDSINNQGTITLTASANASRLGFNNTTTLTGGGTINLGTTAGNQAQIFDGNGGAQTVWTNVDNTIQGAGNVGVNGLGIVNAAGGVIQANLSGEVLLIDPGVTHGMVNEGNLIATNGGILQLSGSAGGDFVNTGGTITANGAGSIVEYLNTSLTGGTLDRTAGGVHRTVEGSNVFFRDVTVAAGTPLNVGNNTDLENFDSLNNQGTITLTAGGSASRLGFNNTTTLTGGGTINLDSSAGVGEAQIFDGDGGAQTIWTNVDNTIQGAGNVGVNGLGIVNAANGVIQANVNGETLTIDPGVTHGMVNQGSLIASGGGILRLTGSAGGDFDNASGTITANGAGSAVEYTSSTSLTGGTLAATAGGVHRTAEGQNVFFRDVTIATGTPLNVGNNTDLENFDSLDNRGTITLTAAANASRLGFNNTTTLTGGGTIQLNASAGAGQAQIFDGDGGAQTIWTNVDNTIQGSGNVGVNVLGIVNAADGVIQANVSGETLTIDPGITHGMVNQGSLIATNGATLFLSGSAGGDFTSQAGASITVDAGSTLISNGSFTNENGSTLDIDGTLNITGGFFTNNDDFNPAGANTGLVSNTGTFTQGSDGTLTFDVNSASDFDQIAGTGTFNLAGGIDINLNFSPNFYESIELISDTSGNNINGFFDEVLFDPIIGVGEALAITSRVNTFGQSNAVLLTRALPGDADLNGQVEQGDLNAVLTNWGTFGKTWSTGDLDGDGQVAQGDLNLVLTNWGDSFNIPDFTGFAVPEPTAVLGLLGLTALRRRSPRATLAVCH